MHPLTEGIKKLCFCIPYLYVCALDADPRGAPEAICALAEGLRHENAEPLERVVAFRGRDYGNLRALPIQQRGIVARICPLEIDTITLKCINSRLMTTF